MFLQAIKNFFYKKESIEVQGHFSQSSVHVPLVSDNFEVINDNEIDREYTRLVLHIQSPTLDSMSSSNKHFLSTLKSNILRSGDPANMLPRMPSVIPRTLQMLHADNINVKKLSRHLSSDLVIAGAIIKLSNSVYYGRGQELKSLERAIVNIGFDGMHQMLINVMMKPILASNRTRQTNSKSISIWEASIRTALLNDEAATALHINPFYAYITSMISQAGITILEKTLQTSRITSDMESSVRLIDELTLLANRISIQVGRNWNFPTEVLSALEELLTNKNPETMSTLAQLAYYSDKIIKINILNQNLNESTQEPYPMPVIKGKLGTIYSRLGAI